jgi:hypothetical protein
MPEDYQDLVLATYKEKKKQEKIIKMPDGDEEYRR